MRGATRFVLGTLVGAAIGYAVIMLNTPRPAVRRPIPAKPPESAPEPELEEAIA